MKRALYLLTFCAGLASVSARGALIVVESSSPSGNAAALSNWLNAVGTTLEQVEHFVDFESGFTDGQNLHGLTDVLPGGLVMYDTGVGTSAATVRSSSAYFGGSNPIDTFAVAHDEDPYLVLDFSARPVDYVSLYDIDHTGTAVRITLVGGDVVSSSFDITSASGDSAEFYGIFRNDLPRIVRIDMDASGDGEWGIDNLRYGVVPEPASLGLLAIGGLAILRRRP